MTLGVDNMLAQPRVLGAAVGGDVAVADGAASEAAGAAAGAVANEADAAREAAFAKVKGLSPQEKRERLFEEYKRARKRAADEIEGEVR